MPRPLKNLTWMAQTSKGYKYAKINVMHYIFMLFYWYDIVN
jgi:hypothetical protein